MKNNPAEEYGVRGQSLREWLMDQIKDIDTYLEKNPIPKLIPAV